MSTRFFVDQAGKFYHGTMGPADREASDDEMAAHAAAQRIEEARGVIVRLEHEQLMPRAVREFMLLTLEAQATPEQLALLPAYVKLKAFDSQIAALRAIIRGEA